MKFAPGLLLIAGLSLSGCQTVSNSSMSLDEARKLAAQMQNDVYVPPPRSSADIVKSIVQDNTYGVRDSGNCNSLQNTLFTRQEVEDYLEVLGTRGDHLAYNQAEQQIRRGNIRRAIELMGISLGLTKSGFDKTMRQAKLAMYHIFILDLDAAETALKRAQGSLNGYWPAGIPKVRGRFWVLLVQGLLAEAHGDFLSAEIKFREVLNIAGKGFNRGTKYSGLGTYTYKSTGRYASSYLYLASNLLQQGRVYEAENKIRDLLAFGSQGVPESRARALDIFSRILLEQGRYSDAEKIVSHALEKFQTACVVQNNIGLISARETYGKVLTLQGKWSEANAYFESIQKVVEGEESSFELLLDSNIFRAIALLKTERWREARTLLQRSLRNIVALYEGDRYKTAERNGLLAISFVGTGNNKQADDLFSISISILQADTGKIEINNSERITNNYVRKYIFESYMRHTIGRYDNFNDPLARKSAIEEGFKLASILRASKVEQEIALSSVRFTVDDSELKAIIRDSQDIKKKMSVLNENLRRLRALPQKQVEQVIVKGIRDSLNSLRDARMFLAQEIEQRFPKYSELIQPKRFTITDIQEYIMPGDSLIATYLAEDRVYIWAIPKSGAVSFASVDIGRDELQDIVDNLRRALDPKNIASLGDIPDFDVAMAHDLYTRLLAPVETGWKNAKNLLVVTNGPLGYLPFSLLPTRSTKLPAEKGLLFANYREVPWLARTHSVTVLPSVASLQALRSTTVATSERRPFVGFGDPYFTPLQAAEADAQDVADLQVADAGETRGISFYLRSTPQTRKMESASLALLPRLPSTRDEINAVATSMGADFSQDVFLGRQASEHQVKTMDLSGYKVLSFATHGLVAGDLDGLSQPALAFSTPKVTPEDDENDDALLTMAEILSLKLNADWVVLSACNTAAADGEGAEAVSGLGRAFFYAGSRALLVSNWPVHSRATTELMTTLFSKQANDNTLSRAEALRKTRMHLIDEAVFMTPNGNAAFSYAHPIFWAPFTLIGDGGGSAPGT